MLLPVEVKGARSFKALVMRARGWHEKTRLLLAVSGQELAGVQPGQRVGVVVPEPAEEVRKAKLPPDRGLPRTRAERIDWFLSSMYCNCTIAGNGCSGMYYTLASCNVKTCGMPRRVTGMIGPMLDKGLSDDEVFELLEKRLGKGIWKAHLLK